MVSDSCLYKLVHAQRVEDNSLLEGLWGYKEICYIKLSPSKLLIYMGVLRIVLKDFCLQWGKVKKMQEKDAINIAAVWLNFWIQNNQYNSK